MQYKTQLDARMEKPNVLVVDTVDRHIFDALESYGASVDFHVYMQAYYIRSAVQGAVICKLNSHLSRLLPVILKVSLCNIKPN